MLFAQATFFVQTNWSMFGFDPQHSHVNPYENVLTTANVSELVPSWEYGVSGSLSTSPAVSNGIVYIGSDFEGLLYAFNASNGTLLWTASTAGLIRFRQQSLMGSSILALKMGKYMHSMP